MDVIDLSSLRGFNYSGSWGTSALDLWQHHDRGLMRVEVDRGKAYFPGWNAVRWWLSHESFLRDPARFLADFDDGLSVFDERGIRVMPVLFNRWRAPICDFGGIPLDHILPGLGMVEPGDFEDVEPSRQGDWCSQWVLKSYLDAVVGTHRDDPRIFSWDLCNEPPLSRGNEFVLGAEVKWLGWAARASRAIGATQPLTIGLSVCHTPGAAKVEPFVDFISTHPYFIPKSNEGSGMTKRTDIGDRGEFSPYRLDPTQDPKEHYEGYLDAAVAFANRAGKQLFASETIWGSLDDLERAEDMDYTLEQLTSRGIGFTVHALHHSLVADLHAAEYGPVGFPMRLEFINADGTLRAGHEVFNRFAPIGGG